MTRPPKAGITRTDIHLVVGAFYERVRANPRLGPIFAAHVGTADADWVPHLAKIEGFWSNVMLQERSYQGNPMAAHQAIPEIEDSHFATWLDLFAATAGDVLPPEKAAVFDTLARRIGRSLQMGLERVRNPDGPPKLFT